MVGQRDRRIVGCGMEIFTIGFTKTTAHGFFDRLRKAEVQRVLDVRLNNSSQLAGFAKAADLAYFLDALLGASYAHEPLLAPTSELMSAGRTAKTARQWGSFERDFLKLMKARAVQDVLTQSAFQQPTALLCSEATAEHCHRRLITDYLSQHWPDVSATHL